MDGLLLWAEDGQAVEDDVDVAGVGLEIEDSIESRGIGWAIASRNDEIGKVCSPPRRAWRFAGQLVGRERSWPLSTRPAAGAG
jgi:hypothetical protein